MPMYLPLSLKLSIALQYLYQSLVALCTVAILGKILGGLCPLVPNDYRLYIVIWIGLPFI